jgi:hypothetical protein
VSHDILIIWAVETAIRITLVVAKDVDICMGYRLIMLYELICGKALLTTLDMLI